MTQRFERVPCLVPFCRRGCTRWPTPYEFLCANHYPLADKELRQKRSRVRRRLRTKGEMTDLSYLTPRASRLEGRLWRRVVAQVIARAAL